jgi:glucose-6-phosphate isomerase
MNPPPPRRPHRLLRTAALIANAVPLGINPSNQFGVELGKEMAKGLPKPPGAPTFDPSTQALIDRALGT